MPNYQHYTGKDGKVELGPVGGALTEILGVKNWKATVARETVDATDFQSDGWREKLISNKSWTVTFEASWNSGQDPTALLLLFTSDAYIDFKGTLDEGVGDRYLSGIGDIFNGYRNRNC